MTDWISLLRFDPVEPLLSSDNMVTRYFARRDLLEEKVPPVHSVWGIREVQKLLKKQRGDGSWEYPGKKNVIYPAHHYGLLETWKRFRLLVERYEFTRGQPNAERAAEFLFSCQTGEGDIRGFIGNQYATYYTGAVLALLVKAGYQDDPRAEKAFSWLLSMRQNDGGWTVPILTHKFSRDEVYRLTGQYAEPVEPDRSKPFSHNWTDMVLRAFAAHPRHRRSKEARAAADLLKSQFFKPDYYSSYGAASYWVRFQFWWPNLLTLLDSLSLMGYSRQDPEIRDALKWFAENQEPSGLWRTTYVKGKRETGNAGNRESRLWVSLAICRIFRRFCR